MILIPIKYHKRNYPIHIKPGIDEIAGHFDVSKISVTRKFSLHTEYSYGIRKLNSEILKTFSALRNAHNEGVPQLWYSAQWAVEFAEFVKLLCNGGKPTIIEIHPPFSDYIETIDRFLEIYKKFEESILTYSPETKILIENRFGSIYKGGKFLISRGQHLRSLCDHISAKNLKLRIALDIPQLLTAYGGANRLESKAIGSILNRQNILQSMTECIHLWGKRRCKSERIVSHQGDLNTYFDNAEKKAVFLEWMADFLKDQKPRYFVPEVNSSDADLQSIVNDLEKKEIKFR
jgi:hypothetical protein